MGYRIPVVKYKPGWKIMFETYIDGLRTARSIPKDEWDKLGFNTRMTRVQALERARALNAKGQLGKIERRRVLIKDRLNEEHLTQIAYLSGTEKYTQKLTGKSLSHWNSARRLLTKMSIEPDDWANRADEFYKYFTQKQWSMSHVQKVVLLMNGIFRQVYRERKQFFDPLPMPAGRARERINDSYFSKRELGLTSEPLTPNQLERHRDQFTPEQYAWLYLTVWFGLRPFECDSLIKPTGKMTWYVEETKRGTVLWVYQTKLTSVPRDKRAKPIPCVRPEQLVGIEFIKSNQLKRPLTKTVQRYLGERVTLYGGRKGFTDLMLSFGYKLEDISVWLGHRSIERTWKSYKDKQRVVFPD